MAIDIDNVLLHSSYNAFKNNGVHRASLALPASHVSGVAQSVEQTFTLDETTDFAQLLVYATDYAKYFRYLDSQYHDSWMQVEQSYDYLVFNSPLTSLYYFTLNYKIVGNQVTVVLTIPAFFPTMNFTPGKVVPIAFVEYTLAN